MGTTATPCSLMCVSGLGEAGNGAEKGVSINISNIPGFS